MADLFALVGRVEVDTGKVDSNLAKVKTSVTGLQKTLDQSATGTQNLAKANAQLTTSLSSMTQEATKANTTHASLQSTLRGLTTGLLGTNIAAVAFGTILGSVVAQGALRMAQALLQSVDAFTAIQNSLTEVASIGPNAGSAFLAIQKAAENSKKPVADLTADYKSFIGQIDLTRVNIDEVNSAFISYQNTLSRLQGTTISQWFAKLGDSINNFFVKVPDLASTIPGLFKQVNDLQAKREDLEAQFNALSNKGNATLVRRLELNTQIKDTAELINQAKQKELDITDANTELYKVASMILLPNINAQLDQQFAIGTQTRQQQELSNQLFQIENQFRQKNVVLEQRDLDLLAQKLALAQAAAQIQPIREGLLNPVEAEMETYNQRIAALANFFAARQGLTVEANNLIQRETARHIYALNQMEMQRNQIMFNAFIQTAQYGEQLLQQLGQKSKAAAIAAIIVGKGIAIATTIQTGIAASTAALAPPPIGLGPVAGWPLSSTILGLTAANVGLIAATGAMQISSAMGGGGSAGGGGGGGGGVGGGGGGAQPAAAEPNFGRGLTVVLEPGQLYSTEQLKTLLEAINQEVANGATLIATDTKAS